MNRKILLDDERVKTIIKEFAEKHNLLQMKYVYERFTNKDYKSIDRKIFVSVDEYSQKTTEITFGIITLVYDDIEEEHVWLEDKCLFVIDLCYYFTEEELMNEIVKKCKKYNIIE